VAESIESGSICCHADRGFFSRTERSEDGGNEERWAALQIVQYKSQSEV